MQDAENEITDLVERIYDTGAHELENYSGVIVLVLPAVQAVFIAAALTVFLYC